MKIREKVGKSRKIVFFQWFGAPEGRKVNSLKRRVRSQLARWKMKNCTALWREIYFQVKIYKVHHVRTPLLEVEMPKKCTPLCREAYFEVKCTKYLSGGPLLELAMSKKCTPLWREAHFEVKMNKAYHVRTPFLEVEMSKKHTPLWREEHFQVKIYKTRHSRTTFGSWDVEKVYAVDVVVARSTFRNQSI